MASVLRTIRERRMIRAYKTLRTIAERHRAEGHEVEFTAVNEALLSLRCITCLVKQSGDVLAGGDVPHPFPGSD